MRGQSLTGLWSGAYRYPADAYPETVFNATIEERDGAFTGSTQEPNLRRPWRGDVVTADIDGVRTGQDVTFTKFMNGTGDMRHAVRYDGVADEKLTRIDGTWTIPGEWSGTFFMTRDDHGEEVQAEIVAEVEADQRPWRS